MGNFNQEKTVKEIRDEFIEQILREFFRSYKDYGFDDFNSPHEGYAVIQEELDELWEEIKHKPKDWKQIRKEAIQVAAMALKFLVSFDFMDVGKP